MRTLKQRLDQKRAEKQFKELQRSIDKVVAAERSMRGLNALRRKLESSRAA